MGRRGRPGVGGGQVAVRGLGTGVSGGRKRGGEIEGGRERMVRVRGRVVGVGGVGVEGGGRGDAGVWPRRTKLVVLVGSAGGWELVRGERRRIVIVVSRANWVRRVRL